MNRIGGLFAALALIVMVATPVRGNDRLNCFGEDNERRIEGCTALIERGGLDKADLSDIHARRGLAYSLKGQYATAIGDYDKAIELQPNFAVALNNRAWAYFRSGKAATGLADVEKSLQLQPTAAHSLDTRAHIRHALGNQKDALDDYTKAMFFGGLEMIKLYQCGLTEARLYEGRIDGIWRRDLQSALEKCVVSTTCDPLPADEKCPR